MASAKNRLRKTTLIFFIPTTRNPLPWFANGIAQKSAAEVRPAMAAEPYGVMSSLGNQARILGKQGDHAAEFDMLREAERLARELGAIEAVNYRTQDFVEAATELTGGRGVSVVLDMVGGDYVPRNLACLAEEGRHVSIAVQRGASAEIQIFDIMRRRLTLTGSTLRPRPIEFKTMVADEISRTVWPYVEGGRLRPVIDKIFPLEEANAAHERMEAGDHVGKIVLEVAQ